MATQGLGSSQTTISSRPSPAPRQGMQQASDKALETVSQVAETAKQQVDGQRDRLAGGINALADALRETGTTLKERDQALVGDYADKAAGQAERVAGYVRQHSLDEIVSDVESFARRQPAVVLGVAFGLGFLASRVIKSSSARSGRSGQVLEGRSHAVDAYDPIEVEKHMPGTAGKRYGNGA